MDKLVAQVELTIFVKDYIIRLFSISIKREFDSSNVDTDVADRII